MDDSRHCPECGENIGLGAVFKAAMPNRIYCPHCGTRLQHTPIRGLVAAAVLLSVGLCFGVLYVVTELWVDANPVPAIVAGVFTLVAGMVLLEVVFVLILWYGSYRLIAVGRRDADDEDDF
jgi:uncharacterized protein (DUF983 family)